MRRALLAFWISSLSWSAVTYNDPACANRPSGGPATCIATVTCSSTVCNTTEVTEIKNVLSKFQRGDTIKLQAGRVWELNNFTVSGKTGTGYLLVTSTVDLSQLSQGALSPGMRITPHYRGKSSTDYANSLMPTIGNHPGYGKALSISSSYIKFRWVRFASRNQPSAAVVNLSGSSYEIHFEQCIFEPDGWPKDRTGALLGGAASGAVCPAVSIRDSYFRGGLIPTSTSVETQLVGIAFGCAELTNNYFGDNSGENVFFGGIGNGGTGFAGTGEVAYNAMVNHKFRMMFQAWAPNTRYATGVIVVNGGQNYYCLQSHVSGEAFDPSKWQAVQFYWPYKNNFECKNCRNLKIHHNLFDGGWFGDGSQRQLGPVIKLSNCVGTSSACQCPPEYTFTCNRNENQVTVVSGLAPRIYAPAGGCSTCSTFKTLKVGENSYTIVDFKPEDPNTIIITGGSGSDTNATCSFGTTNCFMSYIQDISIEHNVIRNGPIGIVLIQPSNAEYERNTFNIRVRHNLTYNMDWQYWRQFGQQVSAADYEGHMNIAAFPRTLIENNTWVDTKNQTYGISNVGGTQACFGITVQTGDCAGNWGATSGEITFRNNILSRGSTTTFVRGSVPTDLTTLRVITTRMCGRNQVCDQGEWEGNVFVGADLGALPPRNYNLCPGSAACQVNWDFSDPVRGQLFENHAARIYKVRPTWQGFGGPIGADWDSLPIVTKADGSMGVDISTAPGTATLSWKMTAPQRHIRCTVELSNNATGWDFDNLIPGIPPVDTETGPLTRSLVLTGLQSGKYYFRLHCGGALVEPDHYAPYSTTGEFTVP